MKFGLFCEWPNPGLRDWRTMFDEGVRQIQYAEEMGYDYVFVAEHHFSNYGMTPAPLLEAMYIAERTSRIKIVTTSVVLPEWPALRLAEEIAVLDNLSGGRIICGVGRKGLQLVRDFRAHGECVVAMDSDEHNPHLDICQQLGAVVLTGAVTDPALLDWLAADFVRHGWSLKHLHRRIVTGAAYRQGTGPGAPALRRLSAEQLRDALLAVSGVLRERAGGPPIWPELPREMLTANPALDQLAAELARATGLGGRGRERTDADKVRKSVSMAVWRDVERIGQQHAALGQHLTLGVNSGLVFRYTPDRERSWLT